MVGGSRHASAQAIFWQLKDKRWGVGGVYPFYCLFLPITAPPVPWVTWSDERVLGVGVHGGGHEATTLQHSVRRQDWKASQVGDLSGPINHPCHKQETRSDTNTHSQQWQERWPQSSSQSNIYPYLIF